VAKKEHKKINRITKEESRTCSRCNTTAARLEFCPTCVAAFEARRNADDMTGDERLTELKSYEISEIPFEMAHIRIEELVGRPVLIHEMGLNWNGLLEEARSRQHSTFEKLSI